MRAAKEPYAPIPVLCPQRTRAFFGTRIFRRKGDTGAGRSMGPGA